MKTKSSWRYEPMIEARRKQEISQYRLCQVLQLYNTSGESSLIYLFEISVVLLQPGRPRLRAVGRNIICQIKMRESSTSGLLSTQTDDMITTGPRVLNPVSFCLMISTILSVSSAFSTVTLQHQMIRDPSVSCYLFTASFGRTVKVSHSSCDLLQNQQGMLFSLSFFWKLTTRSGTK